MQISYCCNCNNCLNYDDLFYLFIFLVLCLPASISPCLFSCLFSLSLCVCPFVVQHSLIHWFISSRILTFTFAFVYILYSVFCVLCLYFFIHSFAWSWVVLIYQIANSLLALLLTRLKPWLIYTCTSIQVY